MSNGYFTEQGDFVLDNAPEQSSQTPYMPQTEPQENADPGILDYVYDAGKGVVGGIRDAAEETIQFVHSSANWVDDLIGTDIIDEPPPNWLPEVSEPDTWLGGVTRGLSQFAAGFVGAGKFLKVAKAGQWLAKGGKLVQPMVQGAIADAVAFDPHEQRLSNLVETFPELSNPVTRYLSADDDDSEAEGRFKNAIEGLGIGAVTDVAFSAFRALKKIRGAKKVGDPELLKKIEAEEAASVEEAINKVKSVDETAVGEEADMLLKPPAKDAVQTKDVDIEGLQTVFKDVIENPQGKTDLELIEEGSKYINIRTIDSSDNFKALTAKIGKALEPMFDVAKGPISNVDTWNEAYKMADSMGLDARAILKEMQADEEFVKNFRPKIVAYGMVQHKIQTQAFEMAEALISKGDPLSAVKMTNAFRIMGEFNASLKNIKTGMGRGLQALNIPSVDILERLDMDLLNDVVQNQGGMKQAQKLAKQVVMLKDNPKGLNKLGAATEWGKRVDAANEWFINSILSGPVTHIVNITSNLFKYGVMTPSEMIIGGVLSGNRKIAKDSFREAMQLLAGFKMFKNEALSSMWTALKNETSILDPVNHMVDTKAVNAISGEYLGATGSFSKVIDVVGNAVRLPTRFMMGQDEFFKQISYRSHFYSKQFTKALDLADELVEKGALEAGAKKDWVSEYVAEKMEKAFDPESGMALSKESLQFARKMTWQQSLDYGIGRGLQKFANEVPIARQVMPFIRTPTNIIRDVWEHTPLIGKKMRTMQAELSHSDPVRVAAARGKMAVGTMFWTAAAWAVAEGKISGGMPRSKGEYERYKDADIEPYSIKVGDKWVSYKRLEPFGTLLGIAADLGHIMSNREEIEWDGIPSMLVAAVASNITNKTYLKGMIDTANTLSDPERYADSWMKRQVASYLPYSSALGQARTLVDPSMREVESVLDAIKNKTPFTSRMLPEKRSWVTGDTVEYNPMLVNEHKDEPVLQELVRLGYDKEAPRKSVMDVDLTSAEYSEYKKLHGRTKLGNKNLVEAYKEIIGTDIYKKSYDDGDGPGTKRFLLDQVTSTYREAAKTLLLSKSPDLQSRIRAKQLEAAERIASLADR